MNIAGVSSVARNIATTVPTNTNSNQVKQATNNVEHSGVDFKQATLRTIKRSDNAQQSNQFNDNRERQKEVSEEEVIDAIEKANDAFKGQNARFEYSIHEDTKRIMVKVVNPENDEVIKEIPSEKILDMVAKIWEMSGILVDEKR